MHPPWVQLNASAIRDPRFHRVPGRPDFSSDPYRISAITSAHVDGKRLALIPYRASLRPADRTIYRFSEWQVNICYQSSRFRVAQSHLRVGADWVDRRL